MWAASKGKRILRYPVRTVELGAECKAFGQTPCCSGAAPKVLRLGFSLMELLVVIAIIALLLSILMPSLGKARFMAMRLQCAHNLRQIDLAVRLYLDVNDDTYPCAQDPLSTNPYYWLWMGRGWRAFVQPYLGATINKRNPSVLFCPQDTTDPDKYENTSYAYSMAFYHSPKQIDDMTSPQDTYTNPQTSVPQRSCKVTSPSGKILIGEWRSNHSPIEQDSGWWCWDGRRNYLFADGHIDYLKAQQIRPANDKLPDANLTVHGIRGRDYPP